MRARASWSARGHHRLRRRIGLCLGLLLLFPAAGRTGGYPVTAFSTSLRLAPELVDETSLLFQLPQRAGLAGSQVFAVNNFYTPYYFTSGRGITYDLFPYSQGPTLGVLGHTHGQSLFLLAQPSVHFAQSTLIQVGWGASWRWLRAGIAARNDHIESENSTIERSVSNGQAYDYLYASSTTNEIWEGSIGIGVGSEGLGFDVAVDLQRPEEAAEIQVLSSDTLAVHWETDDDLSTQISGRLHARLGDSVEFVAAGSWGELEVDRQGSLAGDDTLFTHLLSLKSWSAGAMVSFPAGGLDAFFVSGYWEHREIPGSLYFSNTDLGKEERDRASLAFALRQRLWRQLWGQAGIAMYWVKTGSEFRELTTDRDRLTRNGQQSLSGDFAWGVSYSWRYFDTRAAVSETFDLTNLFLSLDVFVHP
ncbi:MAG TPA: hypothetical protein VFE28_16535 [Candidatus Krumholzibacteria bacterium]|nr:hypothetical protein [Candidatus Krumholzibacteria bacterium]